MCLTHTIPGTYVLLHTQVVLLGSGMDSRPWRLPLPPGVHWYEVDRCDVLAAKQARLRDIGAQTDATATLPDSARTRRDSQVHSQLSGQSRPEGATKQPQQLRDAGQKLAIGGNGLGARRWRYPLLAAGWNCCEVDLQLQGWSQGLLNQGLDSSRPVLWVLEGLLYYLEEADVRALLKVRLMALW